MHTNLSGRTVIYGGGFDPPHLCHQMACLHLLEALEADAVWLVPSYNHPFGKKMADFAARYAICQMLASPFQERVQVLDVERRLAGQGRTYDTLLHLHDVHPQKRFALAIGSDILKDTHRWYGWDAIEKLVPVIVVGRAGYPHHDAPFELPAIASNILRQKVRDGVSIDGLVPAAIARYIGQERLYL